MTQKLYEFSSNFYFISQSFYMHRGNISGFLFESMMFVLRQSCCILVLPFPFLPRISSLVFEIWSRKDKPSCCWNFSLECLSEQEAGEKENGLLWCRHSNFWHLLAFSWEFFYNLLKISILYICNWNKIKLKEE